MELSFNDVKAAIEKTGNKGLHIDQQWLKNIIMRLKQKFPNFPFILARARSPLRNTWPVTLLVRACVRACLQCTRARALSRFNTRSVSPQNTRKAEGLE